MNFFALSLTAYKVVPKCKYILVGTDLATTTDVVSDLYNDAGKFIGYNNTKETAITGILTGATKATLQLLPEGMTASSAFTFTTTVRLSMPGLCNSDVRTQWVIKDKDNSQYLIKTQRRKGCLYVYLCENICGPNC